jgi:S-DNA-T family DNA segregation ATPase FtsK/SpoIIIE
MYAICLDAEERFLPGECQAIVIAEPKPEEHVTSVTASREPAAQGSGFPSFQAWHTAEPDDQQSGEQKPLELRLRVEQTGTARVKNVRPDFVSAAWCARLSRSLDRGRWRMPAAVHAGGRRRVLRRAVRHRPAPGRAARADRGDHRVGQVGAAADLVASLAVANRPDEMTFVLVDYKGGSAFKDCVRPAAHRRHGHRPRRAPGRAGPGVARRRAHGASTCWPRPGPRTSRTTRSGRQAIRGETWRALPRLLLVIDEFASMARDLPDFVTGLVNIAQRGRSLGST